MVSNTNGCDAFTFRVLVYVSCLWKYIFRAYLVTAAYLLRVICFHGFRLEILSHYQTNLDIDMLSASSESDTANEMLTCS